MIYFVILILLIILSIRYDINGKIKYRDQWYGIILVIFVLVAGLRFRLGEDTINYIYEFYHATPELSDLSFDTFLSSSSPPLWILLNSIVKSIGGRFFWVQLVQATIVNTLILKYFRKHSSYPFACTALFFLWKYQWYNMVVMKAAIALSIILFANDYFLEKKYKKGFLLVLLATGFHQSSIILVIIPFLTFLRFNGLGIFLLVSAYFIGAFLQSKLGNIFQMLEFAGGVSNKLDSYLDTKFMTQEHNLNYFIFRILPVTIYPILSLLYIKVKCKESHILRLEPFLMVGLFFQMLRLNIDIFYRYVYIYLIYFIIFIVHFFVEFSKNSVRLKKSLSYVRTIIIVFPFFFTIAYLGPLLHIEFYPYSSVIERSIDTARERYYSGFVAYYNLNMDEY